MSSNFQNKYYIQEEFQQILNNFTKAIIYYKPNDIIDFAIKYFISLEKKIPLKQIEKQKSKNSLEPESALNKEQNNTNDRKSDLNDSNSQDNLEDNENSESVKKVPMTKEFEEIIKINENGNKNKIKNGDNDLEISASETEREKVKDFISELFMIYK